MMLKLNKIALWDALNEELLVSNPIHILLLAFYLIKNKCKHKREFFKRCPKSEHVYLKNRQDNLIGFMANFPVRG